jgi:Tfp pilus assembly protein PilV
MNTNKTAQQQPTMVTMTRTSNINAFIAPLSIVLLLMTTVSLLAIGARTLSYSSMTSHAVQNAQTAQQMEAVVRRYFEGVNNQDPVQIRSCFGDEATIRDVSGIIHTDTSVISSTVQAQALVERRMEFVTAHPDAKVEFYYGPEKGRTSAWVIAHWFETGTWSGDSGGIPAPAAHKPMAVEGQTRFLVDREAMKITSMVVTRTFTEWEECLLEKRQSEAELTSKIARKMLF